MAHAHTGHTPSSGRGMAISAWLSALYVLVEMGIGLWSGSIRVISDADRSFGWYRAEIIGAPGNGGLRLAVALIAIVMGAMRLSQPIVLPPAPMAENRAAHPCPCA